MTSFFQNQEWIDEAAQAIRNVDPAAAVERATRGFSVFGKPSPINATLSDGSQWIVNQGKARKLSEDEIAESLRAFNTFLEQPE